MEGDSFQRLIPVLIFGAVLAFNYIMPLLRRWLRRQEAAAAAASRSVPKTTPAVPAPAAARPVRQVDVAAPYRAPREPAPQVMRDAVASARRPRLLARTLLSDRGSLRQAIVVSTILGQCRANRPHEPGA